MEITTVWFVIIAFFWIGYFILEGFDFGVGMLVGLMGRNDRERRVLINTIGPVWDGNEVWLIVAGAATFAAFPEWYATLFSGFYLPLLLILVALIIRGVAFEYRGKRDDPGWKRRWDACIVFGSTVPAVVWGVAFGNIVHGTPIDASGEYVGGLLNLLNPFALLTGVVTATLFLTHGAVFVALKTDGEIRSRARVVAARSGLVAAVVTATLAVWLNLSHGSILTWVISGLAAVALVGALVANRAAREGWAFLGTAVTVALLFVTAFVALFPNVMPSNLDPAWSLTTTNAASTPYTLKIMTWVAVCTTPFVLAYQGWTYWVFRKRIRIESIPADPAPADVTPASAG